MFIFGIIFYVIAAIMVASLLFVIGSGIVTLCRKIFTKNDLKLAIIAAVIIAIVLCVAISPAASRAEELPDGFYYKVVFIDEVEDQGKELLIHTDDLNHLWDYWEDNKKIDFNNDEKLNDIAKYFIEENTLWSEEETENPVIRGRIVVLIMWECCEDDPFDEEVINVYYTKYVTDVEEEHD